MTKSSSARRLHSIVKHVEAHARGNQTAWQVWAHAVQLSSDLEKDVNPKKDFFEQVPKIWKLVHQVRDDAALHYGDDSSPLLHALEVVVSLLLPTALMEPVTNLKQKLERERVVWGLDSLAYELDRSGTEVLIPFDTLLKTLNAVSDAIRDVSGDTSVDQEFRQFLIIHLTEVQSAIVDYRISGPDAIANAIQRATGAIVLSEASRNEDVKQSSAIKRAVSGLASANELIGESNKFISGGRLLVGTIRGWISQ